MCRGGDRNYPGGKSSGPKPKMDEKSIAKRMKRQASKERTVQRKAMAAAAAVEEEKATEEKALLRKELADQPAFRRRSLGSERIFNAKAAAASTARDSAATVAPAESKCTLQSFFSTKPAA